MSYGLQPSQQEEWKSKHTIRYILEQRIIEILCVVEYFVGLLYCVTNITLFKKVSKKIFILALLVASIVAIIVV